MPIYEYKCASCGKVFEALQKFTDEHLTECKFCQGPVERLISNSSFQLKGSGWYLTDYARKSSDSKSSEGSDAAKTGGDKGGAAGDKGAGAGDKGETTAKPSAPKPSEGGGTKGTSDT